MRAVFILIIFYDNTKIHLIMPFRKKILHEIFVLILFFTNFAASFSGQNE
jgi:hypothetical protein